MAVLAGDIYERKFGGRTVRREVMRIEDHDGAPMAHCLDAKGKSHKVHPGLLESEYELVERHHYG